MMAMRKFGILAMLAALVLAALLPAGSSAEGEREVDLNLVLAVDCSWSVDAGEYLLQMQGLADALRSPDVLTAIQSGRRGRIAITVLQWSASAMQQVSVPWTVVEDAASASSLARAVATAPRLITEGATSVSSAIDAAVVMHLTAPQSAERRVIDVSGDGTNNNGSMPDGSRDRAVASGIAINALAILTEISYLDTYFRHHVIGGPDAFVLKADDFGAYHDAIKRKLIREITMPTV